ncbi:RNA polymerase sigma factor [Dictyobacter alpinus]|uniref:RNA polymerase sigma factor n=1 Tax=Dictyobacter alpinus TaxID=2014873 RepID=UPI0013872CD0
MTASQHGDLHAFTFLVQRYQQRVFSLSWYLLHNDEDANEATQQAFVCAWQEVPGLQRNVLFSRWLYRITYSCCQKLLDVRLNPTTGSTKN